MPLATTAEKAGPSVWRRAQWLDDRLRDPNRDPPTKADMCRFENKPESWNQTLKFMRKQLNLKVEYDRDRGGYVYASIPPPLPVRRPGFTIPASQVTALRLALALASRYLDDESADSLQLLYDLIVGTEDDGTGGKPADWFADVAFTGPPPLSGRHLLRIKRAIDRRRVLTIDYLAEGDVVIERVIEPHFLINAGGDWLVVGWDRERSETRTYAFERILNPPCAGESFIRRDELDPVTFTQHQFLSEGGGEPYDLVLRFSRKLARVARERRWHPSQQIRTAEDGRLELTIRTCGRGDVLRWLLGFGGGVEVISPEWMRRRLVEAASAAASINACAD